MRGRRVELNFRDVATSVHQWKCARRRKRVRIFRLKSKMHLPADLIRIVTSFAWNRSITDCTYRLSAPHSTLVSGGRYLLLPSGRSSFTIRSCLALRPPRTAQPTVLRVALPQISPEYLRRKRMHRKPLTRLLDLPLNDAWPKLLERIGDLEKKDISPIASRCCTLSGS